MSARLLFDDERMRVYPRIFLCVYVIAAFALLMGSPDMVDPWGKPIGYDFLTFYAASKLTLAGDPAAAFDLAKIFAAEQSVVPNSTMPFQWGYPPTFQLVIAPLALFSYGWAWTLFTLSTAALFFIALSSIPQVRPYRIVLMAAPATALCIFHGQNALLTAAIFAGGVALFDRKPVLAGALLGLLAFKPQMGLLLPLAFLAAGRWRAFAGATISMLIFSTLSGVMLGAGLWQDFFQHISFIEHITRNAMLPWPKMPSAFVFCRMLGVSESAAIAVQLITACAVAATVALLWRRVGPTPLAWATLIAGTLLLTPYLFDYELAILGLPLALLASDMSRRGAHVSEKALLLSAFASAFLMSPIATASHLQIGFPVLLISFSHCVWRAFREDRAALI